MARLSMTPEPSASSDLGERVNQLAPIYRSAIVILTWGFRIGATLLGIGLAVAAIKSESIETTAESYSNVIPAIFDGDANGIISLAILCLVGTPVVTTLAVAVGFYRLGDRRFAGFSLIVLCILAVSISISLFR
jgi:uncharacterized membrane protein